jgi:hypothetical protein
MHVLLVSVKTEVTFCHSIQNYLPLTTEICIELLHFITICKEAGKHFMSSGVGSQTADAAVRSTGTVTLSTEPVSSEFLQFLLVRYFTVRFMQQRT